MAEDFFVLLRLVIFTTYTVICLFYIVCWYFVIISVDCPSGQQENSGNCEACAKGYYRDKTTSFRCQACTGGYTTLGTGSTSSTACNACKFYILLVVFNSKFDINKPRSGQIKYYLFKLFSFPIFWFWASPDEGYFERHLMKVILKTHVHTKFDIYDVFIMKLVFAASLLSMQHFLGLWIRIVCPNESMYLPGNCCFSELAIKKSN